MQKLLVVLSVSIAISGAVQAQTPMVTSVQNPASNLPTSIPAGGIAQGSILNAGAPFNLRVSNTAFGISTVDQTGGNAAVVTYPPTVANPTYPLVTQTTAAKPGDVLVLWARASARRPAATRSSRPASIWERPSRF